MTGTGGAKADYLSAGRALEQNRDWSAAIDAYLKVWLAGGIDVLDWRTTASMPQVDHVRCHHTTVQWYVVVALNCYNCYAIP